MDVKLTVYGHKINDVKPVEGALINGQNGIGNNSYRTTKKFSDGSRHVYTQRRNVFNCK